MTQEELDALMSGDLDLGDLEEEVEAEDALEEAVEEESDVAEEEITEEEDSAYKASATNHMPPPATDDHKVVHQLDDVTKESEEKATEIFDIIEGISNDMMDSEAKAQEGIDLIASNIELFKTLSTKFPGVEVFKTQLEKNEQAIEGGNELLETLQNSGDSIMNVMDIMQYQDIHRQKIERVINVMRALSGYMNALFEGRVEDDKRVSSATHLPGDDNTEDVVSTDDIEELLASFGQK
ncbi:MAG: chemotaxis protein [Campylobacterota bacterium]|nr:chemotaxis protein [Campylobacterota bacterium]